MLRVMIVDDSMIIRRNIANMVSALGHKVVGEAKDGLEAISIFARLKPDVVTMDIAMPEMDGIAALRELKKIDKNIKVIMITSQGQEHMVLDSIKNGASGYLLKPIEMSKFQSLLRKIFPDLIDGVMLRKMDDKELEDDDITLPLDE